MKHKFSQADLNDYISEVTAVSANSLLAEEERLSSTEHLAMKAFHADNRRKVEKSHRKTTRLLVRSL